MSVVYYAVKGSSDSRNYYAVENYISDGMAIVDPDTLEIKNGKSGYGKYVLFENPISDAAVLVSYSDLGNLLGSSLYMGQMTESTISDIAKLVNVYSVTLRREGEKALYVKHEGSLHRVNEVYVKHQGQARKVKEIYKKEDGQLKGKEL